MVSLKVGNERVSFKNIIKDDLPEVLHWYNKLDEYMFATGIDRYLTLDEMNEKYNETAVSSYDFFVWIINEHNQKIGILKGSMKYQEKDSLWINSILIDSEYRRRGYGRIVIELITEYTREKFGIAKAFVSVVEDNKEAISFWHNLEFRPIKKLEKHLIIGGISRNIIIMQNTRKNCSSENSSKNIVVNPTSNVL